MTTTLITGATSGIGLELAKLASLRGDRLILIGRRDLAQLDGAFFTPERYCQADLSQADAAGIISDFLTRQGITHMDRLIHNAGVGYFGDVAAQSPASIEQLVQVNLAAPVIVTHKLLPYLAAARGSVVLIGSVVATLPAPEYAVYAATKAALDAFGHNLRLELRESGVRVQVIHPGATRTDMHSKLGIPPERMDTSKFPAPDRVAVQIMAAIERQRPQQTIGLTNKMTRFAGKHAARLIDNLMKGRNT